MTPGLRADIERRYGLRLQPGRRLGGGDEAEIWRSAIGDSGSAGPAGPSLRQDLVVRISPAWRTFQEIAWTHALTRFVAAAVPEAVAPVAARDGASAFVHRGRCVALFPFVAARPVRTAHAMERLAAAELLARLHTKMLRWPVAAGSRPPSGRPQSTAGSPVAGEPDLLADPVLDAWYAERRRVGDLTRAPIHGDYYRRNLRWAHRRIAGVIDWDDVHEDFVMQEVAWSTWEFSQVPSGDDLDFGRAKAFLGAYRAAGGPCAPQEYGHMLPFIRLRLRGEIRWNLQSAARGEPWDAEYVAQELRAFQSLKGAVGPW